MIKNVCSRFGTAVVYAANADIYGYDESNGEWLRWKVRIKGRLLPLA